jgi:hypothetical protein
MNLKPLSRIFSSAKVWTAVATSLSAALTIANVSPAKQTLWLTFIGGLFTLAGLLIWAWGYEDGKSKESGTSGDRVEPANDPTKPSLRYVDDTTSRQSRFKGGQTLTVLGPFVLLASLITAGGCQTSEGYKRVVSKTYPRIVERMEKYELNDEDAAAVEQLKTVSADAKSVRYEDARPAWEEAAPSYRQHVGADDTLPSQRRADWLKTADILDRAQRAELRYRQTLGISDQP